MTLARQGGEGLSEKEHGSRGKCRVEGGSRELRGGGARVGEDRQARLSDLSLKDPEKWLKTLDKRVRSRL